MTKKAVVRGSRPHFEVSVGTQAVVNQLKNKDTEITDALALMLEKLDSNAQEVSWQSEKLLDTEFQALKTNGRVDALEEDRGRKEQFNKGVRWVLVGLCGFMMAVGGLFLEQTRYLYGLDDNKLTVMIDQRIQSRNAVKVIVTP